MDAIQPHSLDKECTPARFDTIVIIYLSSSCCVFIKFTNTPGRYQLLANRFSGTLTTITSPVPVALAIGNDTGTAQMNVKSS